MEIKRLVFEFLENDEYLFQFKEILESKKVKLICLGDLSEDVIGVE